MNLKTFLPKLKFLTGSFNAFQEAEIRNLGLSLRRIKKVDQEALDTIKALEKNKIHLLFIQIHPKANFYSFSNYNKLFRKKGFKIKEVDGLKF